MGPPLGQGPPALPKMGVRARMSNWSKKKDPCKVEPPFFPDSSVPSYLDKQLHLDRGLDLQTSADTRLQFLDIQSPSSRRNLMKMMRSNSEVTISDIGAEDLNPAFINPNTGASLRRSYGSTSTLDRQGTSRFSKAQRVELEPITPSPLPVPAHSSTPVSPSLQAAAQISCGNITFVQGRGGPDRDYVEDSDYRGQSRVQKTKMETSFFSKLRGQRSDRNQVQQQDRERQRGDRNRIQNRDSSIVLMPHRCFSHYDVQSVLFSIRLASVPQMGTQHPSTKASMMPCCPDVCYQEITLLAEGDSFGEAGDGNRRSIGPVLGCPLYLHETGGEAERNLELTWACSVTCSQTLLTCTNAAVSVLEACEEKQLYSQNLLGNYEIEHTDLGARYYLEYFYNRDHQNYLGIDENFGPIALSVRREQLDETNFNYRIIFRTAQPSTLRGSVLEDSVPSSSKHGTSRGLPLKDVLEFVLPEFRVQSLRLASRSPRVPELLLQLDQQELILQHRVAVWFCPATQTTDDHVYNTETGSPALEQFLDVLGHRVSVKGFKQQTLLDTTGDQAGIPSVYTTFKDFELMFYISALPPTITANTTQLLWKHPGNEFVTVIFQEPEAPPFIPQNINFHLQHVFIIVSVHRACSQHTCYSLEVSRSRNVPSFGPMIPAGEMFPASPAFREFLLTKIINAQHAVRRTQTSVALASHRRHKQLEYLVENFMTSTQVASLSSVKFSFISLGGKKECSAPRPHAHLQSAGAITWAVTARDPRSFTVVTCRLAISKELVVLVEEASRQVVFNCCCKDVIGWSASHGHVKLFYQHGHCVVFSTREGNREDIQEVCQRLQMVTRGSLAENMTLRRNHLGQLGFHVNFEGVVADVDAHSFAWQAGLRPGCRLVEICTVAVVMLSHEQMIELLRTSPTVSVVVIPPHCDGTPRRSFSEMFRVVLPTWQQVPSAPPTPTAPPNQSVGSEMETSPEGRNSVFDLKEGWRVLPDWSISSDESTCETTSRTRNKENKRLYRQRPDCEKKVLRKIHSSPSDSDSSTKERFSGKIFCSCTNALSSTTSDGPHCNHPLTCIEGVSMDSGIDSALCSSSALPAVAGATLVLRDVLREKGTTSVCGVTDHSESSSLSGVCCRPLRGGVVRKMQSDVTSGKSVSRASPVCRTSPWRLLTRSTSEDILSLPSCGRSLQKLRHHRSMPLLCVCSKPPRLQMGEFCYHANGTRFNPVAECRQKPLPQVSSHLVLGHLLDAAPGFKSVCLSSAPSDIDQLHQTQEVTSESAALKDSDSAASLSGKVFQLEENLRQLQLDLLKEQQDKAELQQQVQNLCHHNRCLQEESQIATEQIKQFTSWMVDRDLLPWQCAEASPWQPTTDL